METKESKRIVMLEFTGKELTTHKIFETTNEKEAKENNIWNENSLYTPVAITLGRGEMFASIDKVLAEMKEGDQRTVALEPREAFGERNPDLIRVVPLQEFKKQKLQPFIGLVVEINGMYGKVQTISGGRVRIDFNPDLAGRKLEYSLKIVKELKSAEEKGKALAEKYFSNRKRKIKTSFAENKLSIELPADLPPAYAELQNVFRELLKESVPEIAAVEFTEAKDDKKNEAAGQKAEKN